MADPSPRPRSGKSKTEPAENPGQPRKEETGARRESGTQQVWSSFETAYRDFAAALQQAQGDAQKAGWERYLDYVRTVHEAQLDAQTRSAEAYRSFLQTSFERQKGEGGGQEEAEEVQRKFTDTLQQVQTEAQQRVADAWQSFSGSAQEVSSVFEDAYRKYLQSLRDLWSGLDPATVDPGTLTAIAQTLTAAAWSASTTFSRPSR